MVRCTNGENEEKNEARQEAEKAFFFFFFVAVVVVFVSSKIKIAADTVYHYPFSQDNHTLKKK